MDTGQFLREARRRAGMTQRAVAARAGVSQPLIARIEGGTVDPPVRRLLQLVRACGFDIDVHLVPLDEDATTLVERGAGATPDDRLNRILAGTDVGTEYEAGADD